MLQSLWIQRHRQWWPSKPPPETPPVWLSAWLAGEGLAQLGAQNGGLQLLQELIALRRKGKLPRWRGLNWDTPQRLQLRALAAWGASPQEMATIMDRFEDSVGKQLRKLGRAAGKKPPMPGAK